MRKVGRKGLNVLTENEKSLMNGAAIGIAAAMASSRINKPSKNGRVNYKKLGEDAQLIAEAFFGQDLPAVKEAIEGYVESMRNDVYNESTTFADVVSVMNESNEQAVAKMQQEKELAEAEMSPDTVTLRHIGERSDALVAVIGGWQEMEYEHDRRVKAIPRPAYKDALAAARQSGIAAGFYDEDGSISRAYVERIREQARTEREAAQSAPSAMDELLASASEGELASAPTLGEAEQAADMMESNDIADAIETYTIEEIDEIGDDNFFAHIAETLEHPLHDTSGFDVMVADYAEEPDEPDGFYAADTVALPVIGVAADQSGQPVEDASDEEPVIEMPSEEVLEILEPEPVKDPTEPIVMEPTAIAEAIVEEAQDVADGTLVAEVADALVEEMEEVAELDAEECKSFTDQFMAVEVDDEGHAHAGRQDSSGDVDDEAAEEIEESTVEDEPEVSSQENSGDNVRTAMDTEAITEEILAISAKTRSNIKNFVEKQ